jgi:hypothetical protein
MKFTRKPVDRLSLAVAVAVTLAAPTSGWAWTSKDGKTEATGFVDNVSHARDDVGLSKSRFTGQLEVARKFGRVGIFSSLGFNGTFRGSYDGVYDWNSDEFGDDAGGAINMESVGGPASGLPVRMETPWGQSLLSAGSPLLPAGGGFGFDTTANPNEGLVLLGSHLHGGEGGVQLGVPVRPCDEDSRGCIDGYMDDDKWDLASPEFNDRADFIREAYLTGTIDLPNGDILDLSLGRRQMVWGRTDLFRVLDVINPVDYSRHNIYDELEDIRIPMGMLTAEYRAGPTGGFEDLNFQVLWKWEQFRPHKLGQGGSPYAILDAGSFFRAMKNCWDNGCSVSNFAFGELSTDFPAHTIGIRQAEMPGWEVDQTDAGMRLEGVFKGVGFSLNALTYLSQLPSLHAGVDGPPARNPFLATGFPSAALGIPGLLSETGGDELTRDYLIAFDIAFPRIYLLGGSADFYVEKLKSAFRAEFAWTTGEEFANSLKPTLYSESDVARWVIGWDRPTFIPFLNKNRAFLLSAQVFGQHLIDHQLESGPLGKVGMPDWENNYIATFLIKGWYKNDRVSPQVITAYDFNAEAGTVAPAIDWLITNNWQVTLGANIKMGEGTGRFDDNRSANPFPPFTTSCSAPPTLACLTTTSASLGMGGHEPLGRFRSGPIGMAQEEDEVQLTVRYRF